MAGACANALRANSRESRCALRDAREGEPVWECRSKLVYAIADADDERSRPRAARSNHPRPHFMTVIPKSRLFPQPARPDSLRDAERQRIDPRRCCGRRRPAVRLYPVQPLRKRFVVAAALSMRAERAGCGGLPTRSSLSCAIVQLPPLRPARLCSAHSRRAGANTFGKRAAFRDRGLC